MLQHLRQRKEWMFFAALPKADRLLAYTWWTVVLLHGILPALFAIAMGAGLILLDEPTAQLDVRGEAEIFERILAATRQRTTILISHRLSRHRPARAHRH